MASNSEMAQITTINLAHLPSSLSIHLALFTHVTNASALRSQLLASNPLYDYAFIDATRILSPTHILTAVFRACTDYTFSRLRSRNVHSEIVFSLASSNNIADALRRWGITDTTTEVLAIRVVDSRKQGEGQHTHANAETIARFLGEVVEGESVVFGEENLARVRDVSAIRKVYKLGGGAQQQQQGKKSKGGVNGSTDGSATGAAKSQEGQDQELKELEIQILGLMALKGS